MRRARLEGRGLRVGPFTPGPGAGAGSGPPPAQSLQRVADRGERGDQLGLVGFVPCLPVAWFMASPPSGR